MVLLEQFAYDRAVDAFREALALDSSLRLAKINLPIALFYANKNKDAESAAGRRARTRTPMRRKRSISSGLIARSGNRLDAAADAFLRVLQLDADDVGAKVNLALVYVQQRKYREAATLCESALALEPYNATAEYNLGLALTRAGDGRGAARSPAVRRAEDECVRDHLFANLPRAGTLRRSGRVDRHRGRIGER